MTKQLDRTYFYNILHTLRAAWLEKNIEHAHNIRLQAAFHAPNTEFHIANNIQEMLLEKPFASGK